MASPSSPSTTSSVSEMVASLPRHLLQRSVSQSFRTLLTTLILGALTYWLAATLPLYALPLLWCVLGALYAGLSAILFDCAQNTFSANTALNRVVGTIVSLPLLVPFETFRVQALHKSSSSSMAALVEQVARGRVWVLAAVVEWVRANFSLRGIWIPGQRRLLVAALALQWIVAALVVRAWGVWVLSKYWLMPWCAYLLWRGVFLHGAYRVPFTDTEVRVHVNLTKYPKWLRLLTNDVATVLSASRFFSSYLQAHLRVPNARLQQVLAYLFASTDAALEEEREKIQIRKAEAACEALRATLDFGAPVDALPLMTRSEFLREGRAKKWVLCDGLVFDCKDFQRSHPGGEAIMEPFFGNDITRAFNGSVYNHSNGARNLSRHFLIARLKQTEATDEVPLPDVDTSKL